MMGNFNGSRAPWDTLVPTSFSRAVCLRPHRHFRRHSNRFPISVAWPPAQRRRPVADRRPWQSSAEPLRLPDSRMANVRSGGIAAGSLAGGKHRKQRGPGSTVTTGRAACSYRQKPPERATVAFPSARILPERAEWRAGEKMAGLQGVSMTRWAERLPQEKQPLDVFP